MEIIQSIEYFAWIGWIALIAVFLVIEMLSLDFTFLMLGLGSSAGLLTALLGGPLWLQILVAALVAILLLLLLRPSLLRWLHRGEDHTPSNIDALLGMTAVVLSTVNGATGQVKLANGDVWSARTEGEELPPGSAAFVARIEGATAVVNPDPRTSSSEEHT